MTTHEPDTLVWQTSSYSGGNGDCIEVALTPATFLLRDSKNPTGPTLAVPTPHWRRFLATLSR
jgi:hypothetical protein